MLKGVAVMDMGYVILLSLASVYLLTAIILFIRAQKGPVETSRQDTE